MGSFSNRIRKNLGLSGLPDSHIRQVSSGCWNCRHWDNELAKKRWWEGGRESYLKRALEVAMKSPLGEEDPKVLALRKMIPEMDVGLENKVWGWCDKGVDGKGNHVQMVQSTYMCPKYSAAQGASVAREGGKIGELPSDIMAELNPEPKKPEDLS